LSKNFLVGHFMSKVSYHLVHYRKFLRDENKKDDILFEQMCRNALDAQDVSSIPLWQRAGDRVFVYPTPEDRQIMLNRVADLKSAVFGEFCLVQAKDLQAIIELTAQKVQLSDLTTAEIYALSEKSAPQGSRFLRGLLYWLAIGDHLFFVKLNAISMDNMQDYFSWLLSAGAFGLAPGTAVVFQAEFDPSVVKGDVGDIRNLRLSGKAAPQLNVAPSDVPSKAISIVETTKRVAEKFVQWDSAVKVVEALLGQTKTDSLVKSLGPNEYLAVDAAVKIKGSRTAESRKLIREIATEVADLTDAEVRIDGKDGTVRHGDAILRVKMPFTILQDGSNLLEFDNVADQMQEVYRRFVADRKISA
jgi:hypothetical protein